jgi:Spy/CpxP family protein refolding chaperone
MEVPMRRNNELRTAEGVLAGVLQADPVDLASVETKAREIEQQQADLRLARIQTIEQGRAQLTADQRARLSALLAESAPRRLRASGAGPRSSALP